MRHLFFCATEQDGFDAASASRQAAEYGPPFVTWLLLVAGLAICAVAILLF
jgi:hypothetical protein